MVRPPSKDGILRLHVDHDGSVWFGTNRHFALNSGQTAYQFLDGVPHQRASFVRVVGCAMNAPLLAKLHHVYASVGPRRRPVVQLASPSICYSGDKLLDPEFVLQQLWQLSASSSSPGQWHNMSQGDYWHYALLEAASKSSSADLDGDTLRVLKSHPAWPAVSFLGGGRVMTTSLCELLCHVVDPRWFTHPYRPNRISKMCQFLGLSLENMTAFLKELSPHDSEFSWARPSRNYERARCVLDVWASGILVERGEICPPKNLEHPRAFLWRVYKSHSDWSPAKGLLRASKLFVRFLKEAWLTELTSSNRDVFSPEIFFKTSSEVRSYVSHVASCR